MQKIWAETALLPEGWRSGVAVTIGADGRIASVTPDTPPGEDTAGILLPAPANLHSHAFQRAMAGLTEARGTAGKDSFWTWRDLMYRFLDRLTPEDVEAIAAFAQIEMLEAGFASVGEFHYLHHAPGGTPYAQLSEMSARIAAAAQATGIGLTLLPVLYQTAGADGRGPEGGQLRFFNDPDRFLSLRDAAAADLAALPDAVLGAAPHSLRAVTPAGIGAVGATEGPRHIHAAEQLAEVDEILAHRGARPVEWLLANAGLDAHWCVIHATHMTPAETEGLARSGAVAGLCPITEANLGDGLFDAARFAAAGGRFGVGTDSNVQIALAGELRLLEYGQRLSGRARAVLAAPGRSTGRVLFDQAAGSGASAIGRDAGRIAPGAWADLVTLDPAHPDLEGRTGDTLLDIVVFARGAEAIDRVWSAGRLVVTGGRHIRRDAIERAYRSRLAVLRAAL